jgi:cyanophycinase-like exopeptidase
MTRAGPLNWRTGAGWLVLAGGGDWRKGETGEVDAAVLGWADLTRPIALLPTAGISTAEGEELVDHFVDLGGPSGSVVTIRSPAGARKEDNCESIAGAGLIVVADGPDPLRLVRALSGQPAIQAIVDAFVSGAAVVGVGAGGAAFGAWVAGTGKGEPVERGWAWLEQAIVEPHFEGTESSGRLRTLLRRHPDCLGIGVPEGGALALGPGGEVVTVGSEQVTVVVDAERKTESG